MMVLPSKKVCSGIGLLKTRQYFLSTGMGEEGPHLLFASASQLYEVGIGFF